MTTTKETSPSKFQHDPENIAWFIIFALLGFYAFCIIHGDIAIAFTD